MRTKPIIIAIVILTFFPLLSTAQTDSTNYLDSYLKFMEQAQKEYNAFVEQAKDEFEKFLADAWTEYQSFTGQTSVYSVSKPEKMPSMKVASGEMNEDKVPPYRVLPISSTEASPNKGVFVRPTDADGISVNFYGCKLGFHVPKELRLKSNGLKESDISKYYGAMRKNDTEHKLQKELDFTVQQLGLNDWGYFALLRTISEKLFDNTNDQVLFCFYMLHSHGFKARVGRGHKSGQLMLLLALDNRKEVYSLTFFNINGVKYYSVLYSGEKGENAYSYNEKADDKGLKEFGLDFKQTLNLASCDKKRILHVNKLNKDIEVPIATSHLRYYDDMPLTVFPIYFKTPVTYEAQKALDQTFMEMSQKYDQTQCVDILLNFVQSAFAYKIDEKQFGHEKYFFPEETFYYPYSDCEDRSALFGWLVRRYAKCDVIGLLYPDHMATGVCMGENATVSGRSLNYNGKRFMMCDPTYNNAPIGTIMQKYAEQKYEIVEIK